VAIQEQPDIIIVHEDTNIILAGDIVEVRLKIPVAHVETGIK
jgi:UDP-N-acetylglucosamine 2-epimerase